MSEEKRNARKYKSSKADNMKLNIKKRGRKKKSLGVKIGLGVLIFLIFGLVAVGTVFINTVNKLNRVELDKSNLGITKNEDLNKYESYTKIKNIMLFGIDAEEVGEVGRSDSMMILTIDPINNKIKLTSLMRDSYVPIEGYGEDKLNHAYAYGGPELALKTINETFGLNIEDFVTVDFATLPSVINILGGVEVDITEDEYDDVNKVITESNYTLNKTTPLILNTGLQTLEGDQALAYARNRSSAGGDFERTQRQRKILEALFKKGLETPVSQYPNILNKILPLITTNMTSSDILSLGKNLITIGNGSIEQQRFPLDEYADGGYIGDIWYLTYDRETTKQQIQDYIFDDKSPYIDTETENDSYYETDTYTDSENDSYYETDTYTDEQNQLDTTPSN